MTLTTPPSPTSPPSETFSALPYSPSPSSSSPKFKNNFFFVFSRFFPNLKITLFFFFFFQIKKMTFSFHPFLYLNRLYTSKWFLPLYCCFLFCFPFFSKFKTKHFSAFLFFPKNKKYFFKFFSHCISLHSITSTFNPSLIFLFCILKPIHFEILNYILF